jgi:hypothetical protein
MPVTHPWAPSEAGFATSLARPGGNITGVTGYYLEIWGKRLQILKEAVPSAFKAAFLAIRGVAAANGNSPSVQMCATRQVRS